MDQTAETDVAESSDGKSISRWKFNKDVLLHYKAVYRMAAGILKDAAEAEDVTQEAFTRYWQHGGKVEKPKAWLLRVAHNACLDRLRKPDLTVPEQCAPISEEAREDRDPSWHYAHSAMSTELNGLIDKLPEPQRSLIVLFDVRGMSGALCAEILDLSLNQVKVYLHRARKRLREQLENAL